ncbi:MAG: hypothetical protein HFJ50_06850 [Clostridia bacterium]|jgi:hypothetical protein|nr:hypothetical protein [Clostridia bacterium]
MPEKTTKESGGVGNVENNNTVLRAEEKVCEISFVGEESIIRNIDKEVLACRTK